MFHFSPDKTGLILQASLDVFMAYGFKKTSMDDIASAAGMSRPALYQHFANKTDIFRALANKMLEHALSAVDAAFARNLPFEKRLHAAIHDSIISVHTLIDATPHGKELLGVNDEIASDIEQEWCDKMIAAIARGCEQAAQKGEISLTHAGGNPVIIAQIIMHSMEGLKRAYLAGLPITDHTNDMLHFMAASVSLEVQA